MNRTTCLISCPFLARLVDKLSLLLRIALLLLCSQPAWAQSAQPEEAQAVASVSSAPVTVDGNQLFTLRGIVSYPARERAALVRNHIIAAARDETIRVTDLHAVESADRTQIFAGKMLLLTVFDLDAENEGIDRQLLASAFSMKIGNAITQYRTDRSRPVYSALHANIQDVFNEHGVQIMSPAYESDPGSPKVVPPDQWYAAPAVKPNTQGT